ncbi:hypothetical protein BJF83_02205 [Nocardiopsis sp. CNR-923]|uniref:DUF4870 domain-containing protein n=1 Tax=Nocardiopsis sp. CNR-923 TaxID=1904965 RepID=UPI00095E0645|nr:DUF4870 domain-containing protein [Nocardiopsis sp. CNR-923]OLT27402.1 hypothetical protein BJF83_02205 [Nocardiopsis sp. CNR-923]
MSYPPPPPPEDPYGQGQRPAHQEGSGGYPPPPGQPGPEAQPGGHPPHGQQWHGGQPTPDDRQMAFFAHLGGGLLGWIVPLIIYVIKKDESPFVRQQAAAALNFQLVMLIAYVVSGLLMIVLIGYLTWLAAFIFSIVTGVRAGQAVNQGQQFTYPFNVNWVQ